MTEMEEFDTIVDIKANFKDLEQLAQKTMQAKSKIDVIPGQLSYSLSGALSELSGVWTGELEALQQELEHDIRKYSEGLGETVQHIQKTAQGLKEMDMVMNAILMPSNIVLHALSKVGFDVTSKRFISYQGRITPATGQLMARYKKGELYSYDTLFPKSKNVRVKAKNNYETEILEAVKNHKVPSPDALRWGMGLAQDKHIKDPMKRQFIDTNLTNGQAASFAFDFIPFLGGAKAADEARTGKQYFTGKKLDTSDRAIAAASVLGGGFVKWTGKGAKVVLKGKPLSEQTHLKWNKETGEVKRYESEKHKNIDNANRLISGKVGVVTGGNSTKLGKNMLQEMGLKRSGKWSGYQAQHIIPSEMKKNEIIKKIGMNFDDASNGIFLRIPDDDISPMSRHRGYHSIYNQVVERALNRMDINQSVNSLQNVIN
ncbi:AHH domain-containing protein [Priestia endophytica]|uniref:AHH domain-containing protein n=1 Tax=Priestia endophytica TaxID=135735 RepID=UPI0022804AFC|nr:AHH domain-containing protein [Priestia endophytica]MCY8233461.1 AHH domain-containing protein [Priestia endophytica]